MQLEFFNPPSVGETFVDRQGRHWVVEAIVPHASDRNKYICKLSSMLAADAPQSVALREGQLRALAAERRFHHAPGRSESTPKKSGPR